MIIVNSPRLPIPPAVLSRRNRIIWNDEPYRRSENWIYRNFIAPVSERRLLLLPIFNGKIESEIFSRDVLK